MLEAGLQGEARDPDPNLYLRAKPEGQFWASLEPQLTGRFGNKGVAKGLGVVGTGMRVHRQNRATTLRSKASGCLDF